MSRNNINFLKTETEKNKKEINRIVYFYMNYFKSNQNNRKDYSIEIYQQCVNITNTKKDIFINDYGNKISIYGKNYKKQAEISVNVLLARGYDIDDLEFDGTEEWKEAVKKTIEEIKNKRKNSFGIKIKKTNKNFSTSLLLKKEKEKNSIFSPEKVINIIPPYKIFSYFNLPYKYQKNNNDEEKILLIDDKKITFKFNKEKKIFTIIDLNTQKEYTPFEFYKEINIDGENCKKLIEKNQKIYVYAKNFKKLKEEVAKYKTEDWGYILLSKGFKCIEKGLSPKYKNRNTGEIVIMYKKNGEYRYFDPKFEQGGNIISFFWNHGITNYEDILEEIKNPKYENYTKMILPEKKDFDEKNIERLSSFFSNKLKKIIVPTKNGFNFEWLTKERKLDERLIDLYKGHGLFQLSTDYYSNVINKFVFYKNNQFYLSGYQMRGHNLPAQKNNKKRIKSQTATGSVKTISILIPNNLGKDFANNNEKMCFTIGESYVDCLSFIELNNLSKAGVIDTMGMIGNQAKNEIEKVLSLYKNKIEKVYLVFDNDEMGEKYTNKISSLLETLQIPYEAPKLPDGIKDWNDVLKNKKGKQNINLNNSKKINKSIKKP